MGCRFVRDDGFSDRDVGFSNRLCQLNRQAGWGTRVEEKVRTESNGYGRPRMATAARLLPGDPKRIRSIVHSPQTISTVQQHCVCPAKREDDSPAGPGSVRPAFPDGNDRSEYPGIENKNANATSD